MKTTKTHVKLVYLIILLVVIIVPACKTISTVQFQTLEAPKVVLPSDVSRIGFVDRNLHFTSDSIEQYYTVAGTTLKDSTDQTKRMALSCYQGFVKNISEFWTQDSIPFVSLPKKIRTDTIRQFAPLSWEVVTSICMLNQVDVLLVLEDIRAFTNHEVVESDSFWMLNEISYFGKWRIYDPLYQKLYDNRLVADSIFMEVSDSDFDRLVTHKMPGREQMLNDASYEMGKSYVDLILPKWVDVSRDYFVSGDKRLSTALYFMNKNEFDTAINMWESLTKEKDMKLAGRAAYNLAVVHEMKGDLKNARGWIRKAIYFFKKMKNKSGEYKKIEAYALVLDSRWVNGKKIKRFFGEE